MLIHLWWVSSIPKNTKRATRTLNTNTHSRCACSVGAKSSSSRGSRDTTPWPVHIVSIIWMMRRTLMLMRVGATRKCSTLPARPTMARQNRALVRATLTSRLSFSLLRWSTGKKTPERSKISRRTGKGLTQAWGYDLLIKLLHNQKLWWHRLRSNANFWMASATRTKNILQMKYSDQKVALAGNRQTERKRGP